MSQEQEGHWQTVFGFLLVISVLLWAIFGNLINIVAAAGLQKPMTFFGEAVDRIRDSVDNVVPFMTDSDRRFKPILNYNRGEGVNPKIDFRWDPTDWIFLIVTFLMVVAVAKGESPAKLLGSFFKFAVQFVGPKSGKGKSGKSKD